MIFLTLFVLRVVSLKVKVHPSTSILLLASLHKFFLFLLARENYALLLICWIIWELAQPFLFSFQCCVTWCLLRSYIYRLCYLVRVQKLTFLGFETKNGPRSRFAWTFTNVSYTFNKQLFSLFLTVDKCAFDYYPQLLILRESDDTDVLGVITSPPTRDSGHTYCNLGPAICYLSSVLLIIIVKPLVSIIFPLCQLELKKSWLPKAFKQIFIRHLNIIQIAF